MKLDQQDKRILAALDPEFKIDEVASLHAGAITMRIVRIADDRLELTIEFSELEFPIVLSRAQTLKQLGVKDES